VNPEFYRNLLLELTLHRLIAMPLILLLIYAAAGLGGNAETVSEIANIVIIGLLVLWGTRLTADAVLGEVRARTWDSQRMSGIGPFAMSWAKLLGSTVYVWYGVALSVPALLYEGEADLDDLLRVVVLGLFAQAMALLVSLLVQRMRPERLRFQITAAQLLGLSGALVYWNVLFNFRYGARRRFGETDWYGLIVENETFGLISGLAFLAWVCFGIYRLMRTELQFRSWPVGYTAFVLFCAVYVGGFNLDSALRYVKVDLAGAQFLLRLLAAYTAVVTLTWLGAYVEPKGFVQLRRFGGSIAASRPARVLESTPGWLPALLVGFALGGIFLVAWQASPDARYVIGESMGMESMGAFAIALFLFLLRDIGVIYFLTVDSRAKRGQLTALVYLAILHVLLPIILAVLGLEAAMPVLVPYLEGDSLVIILPVLVQVGIVGAMLGWRWRRIARTMAAT